MRRARELADAAIARAPRRADEAERIHERYRERAVRYVNEDSRIGAMCPSVMVCGPANLPTRRKGRQVAAWERLRGELDGLEALKGRLRRIGAAAEPVKAGDAEAVGRLGGRLTKRRADQEEMKQANRHILMKDEREGDPCRRRGYPDYMLTNNNAEIHRLEKRIADPKAAKESAAPDRETAIVGEPCTVDEDAGIMRLLLFFGGEPSDECRAALKSAGFRWAPSQGAWQRQPAGNTRRALHRIEAA